MSNESKHTPRRRAMAPMPYNGTVDGDLIKPTPGPWDIAYFATAQLPYRFIIRGKRVNEYEAAANARLIAEAGTVAHETGLTPRQLAEQRAELLEALEIIIKWNPTCRAGIDDDAFDADVEKARAAIAKAKGEAE